MTGNSPHRQAPPFRDVVERYPVEDLEELLAEGIVSGNPDMPEFTFEPKRDQFNLGLSQQPEGTRERQIGIS